MEVFDELEVEKLLLQLESQKLMDPHYEFVKNGNKLHLLGSGAYSYVYEVVEAKESGRHYAAKVMGLGKKQREPEEVTEAAKLQYYLSQNSEYIMRVIGLWSYKLVEDEQGESVTILSEKEKGFEQKEGRVFQILLTEKLEQLISKNSIGQVVLQIRELQSEQKIVELAEDIGRALLAVHSNGVLHRDVKLENIFYDKVHHCYKLGDFGTARSEDAERTETRAFTEGYVAPEIRQAFFGQYGVTSDIYSFGITIYLLLNNMCFPASDSYHVNMAVQYSKDFIIPAPVSATSEMTRIIRKMCSYDPADRYPCIRDVLYDMEQLEGIEVEHTICEYDDFTTVLYRESEEEEQEKEAKRITREEKILHSRRKKTREYVVTLLISFVASYLAFQYVVQKPTIFLHPTTIVLPVIIFTAGLLYKSNRYRFFVFLGVLVCLYSIYITGNYGIQIAGILLLLMGNDAILTGTAVAGWIWLMQSLRM